MFTQFTNADTCEVMNRNKLSADFGGGLTDTQELSQQKFVQYHLMEGGGS